MFLYHVGVEVCLHYMVFRSANSGDEVWVFLCDCNLFRGEDIFIYTINVLTYWWWMGPLGIVESQSLEVVSS